MRRVLITFLAMLPFLLAFKCDGNKPGYDYKTTYTTSVVNKPQGSTPKGASAFAYYTLGSVSKSLADAGMDHTFRLAERDYPGQQFALHSSYYVAFFRKDPLCIGDGFIVPYSATAGDIYDQSEYDKDTRKGFVKLCAAGKFGVHHDRSGQPHNFISIVDATLTTQIAAQYEIEHAVLLELDPNRYNQTYAVHYHPIFDQGNDGFKDHKTKAVMVRIPAGNENAALDRSGDMTCVLLVK